MGLFKSRCLRMPRGVKSMSSPSTLELGNVELVGVLTQIDVDRQRLGHADGIGELDGAAIGETGSHDVLGEVARGVGGRAVNFGGILTGKGAPAMRSRSAIGIDDDLATGEPAIPIGSADEELTRGIDVPDGLLTDPIGG